MSRCTVVRNEEEYNFVLNFYQLDIVDIYLNLLLLGFFIFLDLFLKLIIFFSITTWICHTRGWCCPHQRYKENNHQALCQST